MTAVGAQSAEPRQGTALATAERSRMEAIVGGNLSGAMLHTDSAAADRAARAGALAVTVGSDIAFARGAYRPGTPSGDALLAHELAHVQQQQGGGPASGGSTGLETEADRAGLLAALRLLAPRAARSVPSPRISSGQGLRLQRCTEPDYRDIKELPSREEYERKGELLPRAFDEALDQVPSPLDLRDLRLDRDAPAARASEQRTAVPIEPGPPARGLTNDEMLARLTVLEGRQAQLDTLAADVAGSGFRDNSGAYLIPPLTFAFIRHDLLTADLAEPPPGPLAIGVAPVPRWTPGQVTRALPLAEQVQRRALDALLRLRAMRDRELSSHSSLVPAGYDLPAALAAIDVVRWDFARAAAASFAPDQAALLQDAETAFKGLDSGLVELLVDYYRRRAVKGEEIAPAVGALNEWAAELGVDLARLKTAADDIAAASARGEPGLAARRREFAGPAQLVATSLDALAEWDTALSAYQLLQENSALSGQEAVQRITWRLDQMKAAYEGKDEPYLRLLVRDHRADEAVRKFYASIPDIIKTSQLIIGFVVLLVASLATAGVGALITGAAAGLAAGAEAAALAEGATAAAAAAEASVFLNAGLVAKIGGEALVFTTIHYGLLSALPGMKPTSSFLEELIWNLALFGAMHGVGAAVESTLGESALLRGLSEQARTVIVTGAQMTASYVTLQAYGLIRFVWEQGQMMSGAEFLTMSVQNLVMMAALSVTMAPFSGSLRGLAAEAARAGHESALARFQGRYAGHFRVLDSERVQLQIRLVERIKQNPEATKKDLADLEDLAAVLNAKMEALVSKAVGDPATDVADLRNELARVAAETEATPVPELLTGLGLDPAVDIRGTGDAATWTIAPGTAETTRAFLAAHDIPTSVGEVGAERVLEATLAGRGPVALVERTGPAASAAPAATPALDAFVAKNRTVAAGLDAVRAQTVVPDLVARLEARAAAGDTAAVRMVLDAARRLAVARGEGEAAPSPPPAGAAPEAVARFEAARNHALALEAALNDPAVAAGLSKLMRLGYRTEHAKILAAGPPENIALFLRALPDLGKPPAEFFEGMIRSRAACELAARYGSRVFYRVVHLQGADVPWGLKVSRARLDIDRVLAGLDATATRSRAEATALADRIGSLRSNAKFRDLDDLVGPRPAPLPAFDPIKTEGAGWSRNLGRARTYADDHPLADRPVSEAELEVRAALLQTVERAESGEFGELSWEQRDQMLDQFNQLALDARLDRGWISATRGILNQALARGTGEASLRTVWKDGRIEMSQVKGSTVPDEAYPPVLQRELKVGPDGIRPVERTPRMWIEDKSYELGTRPKSTAAKHAREAVADLENLPPGSTIAVRYASEPGSTVARNEMLAEFWAKPGIVQVIFRGMVHYRPGP